MVSAFSPDRFTKLVELEFELFVKISVAPESGLCRNMAKISLSAFFIEKNFDGRKFSTRYERSGSFTFEQPQFCIASQDWASGLVAICSQ